MAEARWTQVTPAQLQAALDEPVVLAGERPRVMRAPQFSWAVRSQLEQMLGGLDAVETGGYHVITTLDWNAQQLAEKYLTAAAIVPNLPTDEANALKDKLKLSKADRSWVNALHGKDIHNGALVALDYRHGDVLAYVGSAGYYRDDLASAKFAPQHDAAAAFRQPGSAFKAIVYSTAFDQRILTPGSLLLDISTEFGRGWAPKDADTLERGPVRVRQAIQLSLNLPAIRALDRVGNDPVATTAEALGVNFQGGHEAFLQAGLAGAIGTVETRPLDLTSAFGSIANGGAHVPTPAGALDPGPRRCRRVPRARRPRNACHLAPERIPDVRHPRRQYGPGRECLLGQDARHPERPRRPAPSSRSEDRHGRQPARLLDVRLPRATRRSRRPGARRRRVDGQQRPLRPEDPCPGDLAHDRRAGLACLHARLHEQAAGGPLQATVRRRRADDRPLVRRPAGAMDERHGS